MSTKYSKSGKITVGHGNLKLDSSIGVFSLPAGKRTEDKPWLTCSVYCKECYADKAQKMYPGVLPCRIRNYEATLEPNFVKNMVNLITKYGFTKFRWHESGDIYSQEYFDKVQEIARQLPSVRFYLYTKSPYNQTNLKNLNVVSSYLPDGQLNFGSLEFVKREARRQSVKVCPVTLGVKSAKCGKTCHLCLKEKHMIFVIH